MTVTTILAPDGAGTAHMQSARPGPQAVRDALMAATALVHCMQVVTRNVGDFQNLEVNLINTWS